MDRNHRITMLEIIFLVLGSEIDACIATALKFRNNIVNSASSVLGAISVVTNAP